MAGERSGILRVSRVPAAAAVVAQGGGGCQRLVQSRSQGPRQGRAHDVQLGRGFRHHGGGGRARLPDRRGPRRCVAVFASTTLPFEDRLNAGIIAEALNLNASTNAQDSTASQRTGTSGLHHRTAGRAGGAGPCWWFLREAAHPDPRVRWSCRPATVRQPCLSGPELWSRSCRPREPHGRFRRSLPRRGLRVRLHLGGALDPGRGLQQDRAGGAGGPVQGDRCQTR